jgi:prepilin-type N-terminal cleavage/methylation domain-containing protein
MRKGERGFSILETMVTAAVAGVLAAATFPSLSAAMTSHRLTAGLRKTVGCIRVARSSAITRNQPSRILLSADSNTLTVQVNAGGTWTSIGTPAVLDSGVTVSSVTPSGGLAFTAQGYTTVANQVTVTVNASGASRQLTVSLLGGVEIS